MSICDAMKKYKFKGIGKLDSSSLMPRRLLNNEITRAIELRVCGEFPKHV